MAINYTYPVKTPPELADEVLIIDSTDNITRRASISSILELGADGVTSIVAGTNVTISPVGGTGAVTINSLGGGVTAFTSTAGTFVNVTTNAAATGSVSIGTVDLSASGTKDSTTFLRGDNTWSTVPSALTATTPIVITGSVITLSTVPVVKGGTNITSYAVGDILYASATGVISKRTIGTAGDLLTVSGGVPVWSSTSFVSSTGGTMTGDLVMESNKVTSTADPADSDTLTRRAYVDGGDALKLNLSGGAMTGPITTNSTFDGRDVAADGVTADAALPKAGGTMSGSIFNVSLVQLLEQALPNATVSNTPTFNASSGAYANIFANAAITTFTITVMPNGITSKLFITTSASTNVGSWVDSNTSAIIWAGGSAPTLSTTGAVDVITFEFSQGLVYASIIQNFS
tara:strand:+ start:1244 stop:2452 length:1209 start_codon:yes stop_codon:yes gene_type:complete